MRIKMKKYLWLFVLILPLEAAAQQLHFNACDPTLYQVRKQLQIQGFQRHSAVQPLLIKDLAYIPGADSIFHFTSKKKAPPSKCGNGKKKSLLILPVADLAGNLNLPNGGISGGGAIGLELQADLSSRFSLGGYGRFSQYSFPPYLEEIIRRQRVVPGCGYAVPSALGGHYFWDWDVYANYEFLKYFNLEAGMGRNFWGDGYRTFFLSDQSFSYPYFKITTSIWKIKYVNLYAQLKDMRNTTSGQWSRMANKYGSFHFLSWDVSKRWNIGFFEAIIWQSEDSSAYRGFDINYLNPLIFYRPVEFSVGSPDNSLMGFSTKVKIARKNFLYGQFLMDDIIWGEFTHGSLNRIKHWLHPGDSTGAYGYWTNKQAWQIGFSSFDIFKVRDLDFQFEYNAARPYTFSHRRPEVNYTHYNEALAHPAGSNFHEFLGFLRYRFKQYDFCLEGRYLITGLDSAGTHYGSDLFQSTFDTYFPEYDNVPVTPYGNDIGQGIKSITRMVSLRVSRVLLPALNLRAEGALAYRSQSSDLQSRSDLIFSLGIKTSWYNPQTDR